MTFYSFQVSGSVTLENCPRDYFHLLESPDFRLQVLKFAGSYSQVLLHITIHRSFLKLLMQQI